MSMNNIKCEPSARQVVDLEGGSLPSRVVGNHVWLFCVNAWTIEVVILPKPQWLTEIVHKFSNAPPNDTFWVKGFLHTLPYIAEAQ